jgi:hypothetical protein
MVTRMRISLEPGMDTGAVTLFEMKRFICDGNATTNLEPGKYQLVAEKFAKRWKILGVGVGKTGPIRFTVDLDGPDPFTLDYAEPCELEVSRTPIIDDMPDPFVEMLPDAGPNAYHNDPNYVDNGIASADFDPFSKAMTIHYENGNQLELTAWVPWNKLVDQIQPTAATIYVYYRLKPPENPWILPRKFDNTSAPNITFMIKDIVEALPGANIGFQLGRILLEFVQLGPRPLGRGVTPPSSVPRVTRLRELPKERISPVGGVVNVGGGLETGSAGVTNLNPIVQGTGGAVRKIPNHVPAGFEDMGDIFQFGSVQRVTSRRLPYSTVDWPKSAQAAYAVMIRGGKVLINVWTSSQAEVNAIIKAFKDAGFSDVTNMTNLVGSGTIISAVK